MFIKRNIDFKNRWIKNLLYLLIASPGLFLLVNKYPYYAILSILAVLFLGILFFLYKGTVTVYHKDILAILAIIYLYFLLSYFVSNQTLSNFFSYPFLRYDGNFFFCYLPFFALAVPYFDYRKVSRIYINFIFVIFSIFSMLGIIGMITKNYSYFFLYKSSEGPTFIALNHAHNATASVYVIVSIFALSFLLHSAKKLKIIYGLILILNLFGLVITKSRGGLIAFVAGALIVIWFYYKSFLKFIITTLALGVLSIPLIIVTDSHHRFIAMLDPTTWAIKTRIVLWEKAWNLFTQSPFFGVGFARYNDVNSISAERLIGFPEIADFFIESNFDFSAGHAHNSYLQFLSETGIIGIGLLVLFWILCFIKVKKGYNSTNDDFSKKVFLATLGSIVVLFVLALTENFFSATTVMMCMSMIVSLSIGLYWQESMQKNLDLKYDT